MTATTNRKPAAPGGARHGARLLALAGLAAFLSLAAFAALPGDAAAAQFNASVRGRVSDAEGNPIQDVKVTIRKATQDPMRPVDPIELTTDEEGNYYARNVSLGDSIITYEMAGLETHEDRRELRVGPVRIDVEMKPAEVSESVATARVANDSYTAAVAAFNAGNYADAVTRLNEALGALTDTPDNGEAYVYVYALMGAAYSRQRLFDEAIDAFTRRLEYAAADDAQAHLDLAQALAESGDEVAARPHFEAALQLDPADAATQYNVGVTMVEAGDVEGGIARMERAIELQPVYPLAHKNLGFAYARTEQYAKAVAAFEKYLEQAPDAEDAAEIRDFVVALKEMIG
jgi:tetratricopeptide (TPR) repeat protein